MGWQRYLPAINSVAMNWFVSRRMPILPGGQPPPQTGPQLVQMYSGNPTTSAADIETASEWSFTPPNMVGTGNALVLSATYSTATAPTISDNNGNSWIGTLQKTVVGGSNNTTVWVLPNANAGLTKIKITFGSAQQPVWFECQEWSGIATASPTNGTAGTADVTAPNLACGSFTPGNNNTNGGNVVLAFFYSADMNAGPSIWTKAGNFDLMQGNAIWLPTYPQGYPASSAYFIQSTSAAINPGITATSATDNYNCVAVALKASPGAGTPRPAGIRIVKSIKQIAPERTVSSVTLNFPTTGNLRVFCSTGGDSGFSSVTDSEGNTWTRGSLSSDLPPVFYWKNATPNSNLHVTLNFTETSTNMDGWFVDIANAATGTLIGGTGFAEPTVPPGGGSVISHMPDITPTATNSLILTVLTNGLGPTFTCTGPTGAVMNNVEFSGSGTLEGDSGTVNSGDACASLHNTSTAAQNWAWTCAATGAGIGAVAIEFLSG